MKKFVLAGTVVFACFASFADSIHAGDATITLDDNAGSSSLVVQDVDKTNQFKVNSDGQGYFSGNVGIGTANPREKLYISSEDHAYIGINGPWSSGYYTGIRFYAGGSLNGEIRSIRGISGLGSMYFRVDDDGTANADDSGIINAMTIIVGGNVGIGTTAPSEKLEVSGNIKASGTVSQGSSREFKKNISKISAKEAMKTLNGLDPVRFQYKTDNSGKRHLGFIAEDVPDLVAEADRKHLNSMDITAVLTKVVQEQQRMLQEQQRLLEGWQKENEDMKEEINQLKKLAGL